MRTLARLLLTCVLAVCTTGCGEDDSSTATCTEGESESLFRGVCCAGTPDEWSCYEQRVCIEGSWETYGCPACQCPWIDPDGTVHGDTTDASDAADVASDTVGGEETVDSTVDGDVASLPPAPGAVWMAPNIGSVDLIELFTAPDGWPNARARVDVIQLYGQNVITDAAAGCGPCGPNLKQALVDADAYATIAGWGKELAVELGAVKHWGCTAAQTVPSALAAIETVAASGGQVDYLAMDEPYIGGEATVNGESCGYSMTQSAEQVVAFVAAVQQAAPSVQIGDIEPYPYFRADELEAWLDELVRLGYTPAFFHLDVDRNHVRNIDADVEGDLARLQAHCQTLGVPFGVIYWGQEIGMPNDPAARDEHFYHDVMSWIPQVQSAIGAPDHAIFQSWYATPEGNMVPRNLTEEEPFTMTRLVNDAMAQVTP